MELLRQTKNKQEIKNRLHIVTAAMTVVYGSCLVSSCSPLLTTGAATNTPVPPSPTLAVAASTVSPTDTSDALTATAALAPPAGSGRIQPDLDVSFSSDLSNLPPGDYFLIGNGNRQAIRREALDLKGLNRIPLVSVSGDSETIMAGNTLFDGQRMQFVSSYEDDQIHDGIYILDFYNRNLVGFNLGCNESRSALLPDYLAFNCSDDRSVWHFISRDSWELEFSRRYLETSQEEWISVHWNQSLGPYILRGDYELGISSICSLDPSLQAVDFCLDILASNSSAYLSPDGQWMEIQVMTEGEHRYGLVPTSCLKDRNSDCEPSWIEDPPSERSNLFFTYATWHPDGSRIIYIEDGCQESYNSTFWMYDLEADQSEVIATFPACLQYVKSNGQAIWLPDGSGVVIYWGDRDPKYQLFSDRTGEIKALPINQDDFVTGTFVLPGD
ncbi:MAG: hypothetical protein P1P76_11930 [Anaerolineales bacterium]|nr:hypothetical protein [Anaerolineales bacterium]